MEEEVAEQQKTAITLLLVVLLVTLVMLASKHAYHHGYDAGREELLKSIESGRFVPIVKKE